MVSENVNFLESNLSISPPHGSCFLYPVQTTFAYLKVTNIFSSVLYRNFIVVGLHLALKLIFVCVEWARGWGSFNLYGYPVVPAILVKRDFPLTLYWPGTIVKSQLTCVGGFLKFLICFIDLFVSIFLIPHSLEYSRLMVSPN